MRTLAVVHRTLAAFCRRFPAKAKETHCYQSGWRNGYDDHHNNRNPHPFGTSEYAEWREGKKAGVKDMLLAKVRAMELAHWHDTVGKFRAATAGMGYPLPCAPHATTHHKSDPQ